MAESVSVRKMEVSVHAAVVVWLVAAAAVAYVPTTNANEHRRLEKGAFCETKGCAELGRSILYPMDLDVDPCDDFYEYACGNWGQVNPIPDHEPTWSLVNLVHQGNLKTLRRLFDKFLNQENDTPPAPPPRSAIAKAITFYSTCLDAENVTRKNSFDLISNPYLSEDVSWTALHPNSMWTAEDAFQLSYRLGKIHATGGFPFFMPTTIQDSRNSSNRLFGVQKSPLLIFSTPLPDVIRPKFEGFVREVVSLAFPECPDIAQEVAHILQIETRLSNITHLPSEFARVLPLALTKRPLFEYVFNWTNYVDSLLSESGVSPPTEMFIPKLTYWVELQKIILTQSPASVMAYLRFYRLFHLHSQLDPELRHLFEKHKRFVDGRLAPRPRWEHCLSWTSHVFGPAVGALLVRESFSNSSLHQVKEMFQDIKKAHLNQILASQWIGEEMKGKFVKKLEHGVEQIGYPDFIMDSKKLDKYFEDLQFSEKSSAVENLMIVGRWASSRTFKALPKPIKTRAWMMSPSEVNAFYFPTQNSVVVPVAILQPPLFSLTYPRAVNFGRIGTFLSHEQAHAFDSVGCHFDENGNASPPNSAFLDEFHKKVACVKESLETLSRDKGIEGDIGSVESFLREAVPDFGEIEPAFEAYLDSASRNLPEPSLPGLQFLSSKRLFFVSYAQTMCSTSRPDSLVDMVPKSHAPDKLRILGTLQNSPTFSEVWQCPAGSLMNPTEKCKMF